MSSNFKASLPKTKLDKQGLEKRMSTIEQDAEKIRLEVSKQTFSGVNILKGREPASFELIVTTKELNT